MNWNNLSLIILGLTAFLSAFIVALWVSLVIWTFRDMRARSRDAFAQLLAALMILVLGPLGMVLYFMLRPRETLAEKYERSLEEEALLQDIEERQICPGCKQPIEPDFVLCPICNVRLRTPCIHCGRLIHPRWSVCPYCAESQKPIPGVERAGTVTLLDLEEEEPLPVMELDQPPSIESLEAEALGNLDEVEEDLPLEWEWEPDEAETRAEQSRLESFPAADEPELASTESVARAEEDEPELFPATDETLDLDPPLTEPEKEAETGPDADQPSGGILSLFKRR